LSYKELKRKKFFPSGCELIFIDVILKASPARKLNLTQLFKLLAFVKNEVNPFRA